MKAARAVAEKCGPKFALALTLAIISFCLRDQHAFSHGVGTKDLQVVLRGIEGLEMPKQWKDDKTITADLICTQNWDEVGQMLRLMKALVLEFTPVSYADVVKKPSQDLTMQRVGDEELKSNGW